MGHQEPKQPLEGASVMTPYEAVLKAAEICDEQRATGAASQRSGNYKTGCRHAAAAIRAYAETLKESAQNAIGEKWAAVAIAMLDELRQDYAPGELKDTDGVKAIQKLRASLSETARRPSREVLDAIVQGRETGYALGERATQEFVFEALSELTRRIEACGASVELTNAVILCSDLKMAIGNRWNPADRYAEDRVRAMLAAAPSPEEGKS